MKRLLSAAGPLLLASVVCVFAAADLLSAQDPPAPPPAPAPPLPTPPPPIPPAGPTLTLPAEVKGDPGAFVRIAATTNGREVKWIAVTPGLNVFPAEMLRDSRSTVVVASAEGRYQLLAYTALDGLPSDPATTTILIGSAPPPQPPGPAPPPVPPVDLPSAELQALVAPLRAIMQAAPPAQRAVWAGAWSDLLVNLKTSGPPSQVAAFKAALGEFMRAAAAKGGLAGAFPGFGAAFEAAFVNRFGAADGVLEASRAVEFVAAVQWACK